MDVFLIFLPAPERLPALVQDPAREFVWGQASTDEYLWNGEPLGTLRPARIGPTALARLPARFAARLDEWKILSIGSEAQERYRNRLLGLTGPTLDLDGILLSILRGQPDWIVWCELDAEQYPVEYAPRGPEDVAAGVRRLTLVETGAPSFVAWPLQVNR